MKNVWDELQENGKPLRSNIRNSATAMSHIMLNVSEQQ